MRHKLTSQQQFSTVNIVPASILDAAINTHTHLQLIPVQMENPCPVIEFEITCSKSSDPTVLSFLYVLYIAKTIAVQNQVNLKKSMKLIPLC